MTYAIPDDVAVELGRPASSQAETDQWQSWIDRVERAIARRFKRAGLDLAVQVAAGEPSDEDVADVEVAAVVRQVRYAEAAKLVVPGTSRTRSVDDGSITDRNDGRLDSGYDPLALTDGEWADLLPSGIGGAFSTRPGFEPDVFPVETWL